MTFTGAKLKILRNRSEPVLQLVIHVTLLEKLNKVTNFTGNP